MGLAVTLAFVAAGLWLGATQAVAQTEDLDAHTEAIDSPAIALGSPASAAPSFETRWSRARSLLVGGRLAEAEQRLRLLTDEEPQRLEPWLDLVHLLVVTDRCLSAYRLAHRIEALAPGHPDVALIGAALASRVGDRDGALRRLRASRSRDPSSEALRLAERAVEHRLDPIHVLALPRPLAEEWLADLDEADAMSASGHWLGAFAALTGVGALVSILAGVLGSFSCALGGCTDDSTVVAALGGLLGAGSIGLIVAAVVTRHDARVRRAAPMTRFEALQRSRR